MKPMAQISIIVPVYQAENYLGPCIDSILAQTFRDFELILVDDGSKDRSGRICDEYAEKDGRIRVLHTENGGPGMARNRGMAAASGEYLCFLDSDDLLDGRNALAALYRCAEESRADITVGNYRHFSETGVEGICAHGLTSGDNSRTARFRYRGFYLTGHLAYNWGKLYRRGFLTENHLEFQNFSLAEDKLYNLCCYACQPNYAFTQESVVLYRRTENSLTRRRDAGFIENWLRLAECFSRFLADRAISADYSDILAFHMFYGSFFIVEQGFHQGQAFDSILRRLREYGKQGPVRRAMGQLARGRYLSCIPLLSRRVITWGASAVFSAHGYRLFAAATELFVKTQYP